VGRLLFVTGNPGKAREVAHVLGEYGVALEIVAADLPERRGDRVEEIARDKAFAASQEVGRPLIVEDTGLFLEAYPDFPGPMSRWVVQRIGIAGLMRLLEGRSREAHFRSALAYLEPGGRPQVFTGVVAGALREVPAADAEKSLPYDPVFAPTEGDGRVYSEMELDEKLALSSRGRAARAFAEWWLRR